MTTTPIFNSAATEPARREQASITEGHAQILRKLGRTGYAKQFGKAPDAALVIKVYGAPKPPARTPAARVKSYSTGRTLHRYACKNWLPTLA